MPVRRLGLPLPVLFAAASALALPACGVQRVLTLDSRPSGARIWVNGAEKGTTPVRIPYVHPGLFTIRLEKAGYEPVAEEVRTETKLDAVPVVDLFAENLGRRREQVTARTFELVPLKGTAYTDAEMDEILRRAADFRQRMDREVAEPGTPAPTRPAPSTPATPSTPPAGSAPRPPATASPPPPPPPPAPLPTPPPTKPSGTPPADR